MQQVERRWLVAWLGGVVVGVSNGIARDATYGKVLDEQVAHQVSSITGIAAFSVLFWKLQRRWPIPSNRQALEVGAAWLFLTVVFELAFGRLVAKTPWRELVGDYNLAKGRTWPLVLAWIAVGPAVVRNVQRDAAPSTP
jgi:hypothetical protein